MEQYIGCKIIKAEPMTLNSFSATFKRPVTDPVDPMVTEGYHVQYPDGYDSWSPKDVFESAYRIVTEREINFMAAGREPQVTEDTEQA